MDISHKYARIKALKLIGHGVIECIRCGCKDIRFLEINHKKGGGHKEGHNKNIHRLVNNGKRDITDLEILCRPCNSIHYLELKHGNIPLITKSINEDWILEL